MCWKSIGAAVFVCNAKSILRSSPRQKLDDHLEAQQTQSDDSFFVFVAAGRRSVSSEVISEHVAMVG